MVAVMGYLQMFAT